MNLEESEKYILEHMDQETPLLQELNRETYVKQLRPRMLSGHLQGRILSMLCKMIQPQRILELGTYTGYSALCMAEALPHDGEIHTIEINDELETFTRSFWNRSAYKDLIHLHIGDIQHIVPQLEGMFDLVFIDANKRDYVDYYHLVFPKVKPGGFIFADNVLWSGKVFEDPTGDEQTRGIVAFNELIKEDKQIEKVILPIRDGITIIRKLED